MEGSDWYMIIYSAQNELYHYGIKRRSGRYPYGSGDRPFQSSDIFKPSTKIIEKSIKKRTEVANSIGIKPAKKEVKSNTRLNLDEKTELKKGEKVQHITGVPIKSFRNEQLYVTETEKDNELYTAFLGANLKRIGYTPMKAVLTLKEDLKAPSANEQYDTFKNMLEDDGEKIYRSLSKYLIDKGKFKSEVDAVKNLKERSVSDLYIEFTNSFEKPGEAQGDFYKKLKSRGYNALLDEHDRLGSWMLGKKPLIIMDALNSIGDFKIEDITDDEIKNVMERVLGRR